MLYGNSYTVNKNLIDNMIYYNKYKEKLMSYNAAVNVTPGSTKNPKKQNKKVIKRKQQRNKNRLT